MDEDAGLRTQTLFFKIFLSAKQWPVLQMLTFGEHSSDPLPTPVFLSEKLAQYLQGKGPSVPNVVFAGGGAKIWSSAADK